MKRYIPRRVLALLVSVAMVLSMLCSAFAVETDTISTDPFDFSDVSSVSEVESEEEDESEEESEEEESEEEEEEAEEEEAESAEEEDSEDASEDGSGDESSEETDTNAISLEDAGTSAEESISVASNEAESTLIYVNGALYTGYYMDADGLLYSVESGIATAATGYLKTNTVYYKADGTAVRLTSGAVCVDGAWYTGYFMNGGKMYKCTDGAFVALSAYLGSGSTYYKNGTGFLETTSNVVYINGSLHTGYYYNTGLNRMYTCTNGAFEATSAYLTTNTLYYKSGGASAKLSCGTVYVNGYLYTGYFVNSGNGKMYKCTDGTSSVLYSGYLSTSTKYYKEGSGYKTLSSGKVYIKGALHTGYFYNSGQKRMYTCTSGNFEATSGYLSTNTTYYKSNGSSAKLSTGTVYVNGYLYTGYFMNSGNGKMYTCTNGTTLALYTGTLSSGTKYYKSGTGYVTLSEAVAYKSGVAQTNGWKFSNNYAYYYVGGTKVTGWYYIKRNGTKYKYYFDPSDGHLVTNLYAYFGSSYKYKKCKLVLNLNTRNASILGYDSATGSYCIPYYSFIIGISKTGKGPQAGNTYALSSNVQKKWFTFADNGRDYYYAYATLISGSGGYIHSERYSTNGDLNTLVTSTYNGLGTKQSSMCIRAQLYVAKLVYDVRQSYSGSIKVQVVSNSTYGPFGKITLSSTTGKVSSSTKSDPTGVSSYKGYIKQTAV